MACRILGFGEDAQLKATVAHGGTSPDAMEIPNGKTCQNFLQALKANAVETAEKTRFLYI